MFSGHYNLTTFTPSLAIGGSTTGISYFKTPTGFCYQWGDLCLFYGTMTLTSKGSNTGVLTIIDFPITFTTGYLFPMSANCNSMASITNDFIIQLIGNNGTSQCTMWQNTVQMTNTNVTNSSVISFQGTSLIH
jgi:hypothetical protein